MMLDVAGQTDVGRVRTLNEDHILITPGKSTDEVLCVLADGMGGHAAGEVASEIAVQTVTKRILDGDGIEAAIVAANTLIWKQASEQSDKHGMGTTVVVTKVLRGSVHYAHVGDSRLYLVRDGAAKALTHDHSWVGEQVRAGVMTEEEARTSPRRNLITRALGVSADVKIDLAQEPLWPGDMLILCSDGVCGLVTAAEFAAQGNATASDACKVLIDRALALGAPDNASVIAVRVRE